MRPIGQASTAAAVGTEGKARALPKAIDLRGSQAHPGLRPASPEFENALLLRKYENLPLACRPAHRRGRRSRRGCFATAKLRDHHGRSARLGFLIGADG